jgi:GT2 family glycosyltransferase
MEQNLKILVASPTYGGMKYCLDDFLEHLLNIKGFKTDILLMDNSMEDNFFEEIKKIKEIKAIRDKTTEEDPMLRLINSRNRILNYASKEDYDYLLMMDGDVMVPQDILEKLISANLDVISGLYFNIFNSNGKQKLLPVCWREIEEDVFQEMKSKRLLPEFIKSKKDLRRNLTPEEVEKGEILEVLIPSAGCLLLSRKAFTSGAKYGLIKETNKLQTTDDIYFLNELKKKGFSLYCNPSGYCKHLALKKYVQNEGSHPLFK